MNKLEKLLAIGLVATGISVAPAHSQTCTVPPSCDALGFTKSTTDCVGMDTLRCPFDQSKVFCSKVTASTGGGTGSTDAPLAEIGSPNTYELGSKFYNDKNEFLGYFMGEDYVFDISPLINSPQEASDYCKNKTTGGLTWGIIQASTYHSSSGTRNLLEGTSAEAVYNAIKNMSVIITCWACSDTRGYDYGSYQSEKKAFVSMGTYSSSLSFSIRTLCRAKIKSYD